MPPVARAVGEVGAAAHQARHSHQSEHHHHHGERHEHHHGEHHHHHREHHDGEQHHAERRHAEHHHAERHEHLHGEPHGDDNKVAATYSRGSFGRVLKGQEEDLDERTGIFRWQGPVRRVYYSFAVQCLVATLIFGQFFCNVLEMQVDPRKVRYSFYFERLNTAWNVLFTVELLINMYANWFCRFWWSLWHIFDFTVVSLSWLHLLGLAPSVTMIRAVRAFRVFRLFHRVKSLNRIISALGRALAGLAGSSVILTIMMAIYAMMAVQLFSTVDCPEDGVGAGGACFGDRYFGTFAKAFYTLFQVLTGESWSQAIARPVIWEKPEWFMGLFRAFFFVTFIMITGVVLVNVFVAVLLEKMFSEPAGGSGGDGAEGDEVEEELPLQQQVAKMSNRLDEVSGELREQLQEFQDQVAGLGRDVRALAGG